MICKDPEDALVFGFRFFVPWAPKVREMVNKTVSRHNEIQSCKEISTFTAIPEFGLVAKEFVESVDAVDQLMRAVFVECGFLQSQGAQDPAHLTV